MAKSGRTKLKPVEHDLLAKWASVPKFAGKWGTKRPVSNAQKPAKSPAVEQPTGFRRAVYEPGVGALKASPKYTGTECLGVTVMHKSCLQPVFCQEAAIDAAKMRR